MSFLEKYNKWANAPYQKLIKGKPETNYQYYCRNFGFVFFNSIILLLCYFAFYYTINTLMPMQRTFDICHAAVPAGYHPVTYYNQTCVFSNGNEVVYSNYTFDETNNQWILYKLNR